MRCSYCLHEYDRQFVVPRKVPKCGHTFCEDCITCILTPENSNNSFEKEFTCPLDK